MIRFLLLILMKKRMFLLRLLLPFLFVLEKDNAKKSIRTETL